ncbi:MAG: ATP-dependent helicase HrpB [Acidimicrobiia bacterium]|nr:ATP-dependent helicase HrpB [Acidimicrobiia bacterium]
MLSHTSLPVEGSLPSLRSALAAQRQAVLVAPPGSGKTTIVPLLLLAEPWLEGRKITVLEPRRLATRAAARRMAFLLGEQAGETVGYVTKTDRKVGPDTRIEVVTEGVLTRRLQRDPELPGVGLVVFDEFHERSLQTDLGLALALDAKRMLRPDLRLLVMSATIDADKIAGLLGGAPVIRSEARSFPVEVRWEPRPRQTWLEPHVVAVVRQALRTDGGDILVFLPGIGEINRVMNLLRDAGVEADIHRLHGSLSIEEQDAALTVASSRKVVLSTDIAESSLTVEGVRVVVDGGAARAPRFDSRTGMTRLKTIPISKASADQRSGRAGRTEPGVAYRLWSKVEHGPRKAHIEPEITQVDLAGFALELAAWGAADASDLDFLDRPPRRALAEAHRLLGLLGAVDGDGRLTESGRAMVNLPLHPRLARMVVDAGDDQALACLLAAVVDDRDILRGPSDEIPVDVALRIELVTGAADAHPNLDRRALERLRRNARDLARRADIKTNAVDPDHCGRVLALAFPDRLAVQRGTAGRFQLRTGTSAWMASSDSLAGERFVVVADLDGKRKDARIRLAAALVGDEVSAVYGHEVEERAELVWVDDRLMERRTVRLGGMVIEEREQRAAPGPEATAAVISRLQQRKLEDLPWTDAARSIRDRVAFLRNTVGSRWPDWSTPALVESLEDWLLPSLGLPTGFDRFDRLDLASVLRGRLGYPLAGELERLAPKEITVPSGRSVRVDYSRDWPTVAVRVQEMYGTTTTPTVGGQPVVLQLLSPARRPLQITRDLGGFWTGSWSDVRKEMAGRYPKHDWPDDPATATPTS